MSTRNSERDIFGRLRKLVDETPSITPTGTPAPVVEGGYGRVPGAAHAINTNRQVPQRHMTEADARNLMNAEILAALRQLVTTTTELTSTINHTGALNGVIGTTYVSLTDIGNGVGATQITRPVTIGCALILNASNNPWVVQIGPGVASSPPSNGIGFFPIPAGAFLPVPISQKAFVIYGTPADSGGVQLFSGLQGYGASIR